MKNEKESFPWYWMIKYLFKKWMHDLRRIFHGLGQNRFVALIIPWVTGSYYLMLDVWGDDWKWISAHKNVHEKVFILCLLLSLILLFIRGLEKNNLGRFEEDRLAKDVLRQFITTIAAIVQVKIQRFRGKIPSIKKNSDKFSHITHPKDQLSVIANSMAQFLLGSYGLKEDQISITILKKIGDSGNWSFFYDLHEWRHTDAQILMKQNSAAKYCLETGEELFIADKIQASMKGRFFLTSRDKRRGGGSAYFYPLRYDSANGKVNYLVSVVTYGAQFCHEYQVQTIDITKAFLREFVRRFELELCLQTIKTEV